MNRLLLAGSTLACLTAGALATPASAAVPAHGLPPLTTSLTEQAQYMWGGSRYCFYPRGWHGPGWYRCGFAWRRGLGWGGGSGWQGWDHRRMGGMRGRDHDMRRGRDFDMRRGDHDMRRGREDGMRGGGRNFDRGGMRGGDRQDGDRGRNR